MNDTPLKKAFDTYLQHKDNRQIRALCRRVPVVPETETVTVVPILAKHFMHHAGGKVSKDIMFGCLPLLGNGLTHDANTRLGGFCRRLYGQIGHDRREGFERQVHRLFQTTDPYLFMNRVRPLVMRADKPALDLNRLYWDIWKMFDRDYEAAQFWLGEFYRAKRPAPKTDKTDNTTVSGD